MKQYIKNLMMLFLVLGALETKAQQDSSYGYTYNIIHLDFKPVVLKEEEKKELVKGLEAEIEFYPLNLLDFGEKTFKLENMFDYHHYYLESEKILFGTRYYNDVNIHYGHRDMVDLIWYEETYYGSKYIQAVVEVGSLSGQEYICFGLQGTCYEQFGFQRLAINTCFWPDVVYGYEYTTKEFKKLRFVFVSSTGTGRYMPDHGKIVAQTSAWLSFPKLPNFYFGAEYEFNTELPIPNEVFGGFKFLIR